MPLFQYNQWIFQRGFIKFCESMYLIYFLEILVFKLCKPVERRPWYSILPIKNISSMIIINRKSKISSNYCRFMKTFRDFKSCSVCCCIFHPGVNLVRFELKVNLKSSNLFVLLSLEYIKPSLQALLISLANLSLSGNSIKHFVRNKY